MLLVTMQFFYLLNITQASSVSVIYSTFHVDTSLSLGLGYIPYIN